jgi:S1-C subfamily serine protease
VFICVLAVVLAGIIAFLSIYEIQIERTDGGFSMRVVSRGQQPEKSTQPDNSQTPTDNGPGSTSDKNNNPPDGTRPQLNITDTPQASGTASDAMTLQEIYRKVIPSVVSITVSSGYGADETGTGVIMADDGYIITNYHVVNGAGNITVLLYDDSQYTGTLLAYDELSDLAVVKINADDLTAATFGDSDALQVGIPWWPSGIRSAPSCAGP